MLESLPCASWLVYATRATDESARRVKNLIIQIKVDRIDSATGVPTVRLVVKRVALRLGDHVQSTGNPARVLAPVFERITIDGRRCRRGD